jgi:large subunit ribosomal protein L19
MNHAVAFVHEQLTGKKEFPKFKAGDNITVNYKIIEGNKERIQSFKGDVIKLQGQGATATFTVRKISDGVGVERLFPFFSPNIDSIILHKSGRVRRAKLFYQRERSGKRSRKRKELLLLLLQRQRLQRLNLFTYNYSKAGVSLPLFYIPAILYNS